MAVKERHKYIVHLLARYGCFSIGMVYLIVGVIAILSFLKMSKAAADEARMVEIIMDLPLGEVLLWILIIGLGGYIVWRVFEAVTDPYEMGGDYSGLAKRTGIALSGFGYGLVAYTTIQIMSGNSSGNEQETQLFIAEVFTWAGGRWLVGLSGLMTALAGITEFYYVAKGDYTQRIHMDEFSEGWAKAVHALAWAGFCARGILLLVLGYFFIKAAIQIDPQEIGDTDTAFDFIGAGGSVLGDIAFILVAGGTIAYGIFMFVFGSFHQFKKEYD
ncbi:DUF1206 domain-containing protein [Pontibacter diazotrophicus]|uniref:DUF1206 domain-containing protein n=1 Tax=Pontibacter diazotrophicus TaxID=1400979 RepID=A0A3D8LH54_9BACT|nr:DUF1206 domain-containing protein [Pontibacter diazotrophicus]RDV16763.1 DUF1206 domain-containing protein [Pontibacter diazotrophicus]